VVPIFLLKTVNGGVRIVIDVNVFVVMEEKRNSLSKELLEILACPRCKRKLSYDRKKQILICHNCKVYYKIIDNIPNMLPEEAKDF